MGILPGEASVIRLARAVLSEIQDEWQATDGRDARQDTESGRREGVVVTQGASGGAAPPVTGATGIDTLAGQE